MYQHTGGAEPFKHGPNIPGKGPEGLLTVRQVAERLAYTAEWVRHLCATGKLRAVKLGRQWRIPESAVQELLHVQAPDHDDELRQKILAKLLRSQLGN